MRYEVKMSVDSARRAEVQSWVRLHSAGFHTAFPPRQVNNIYFDTPDLDSFNDHLGGATERRKLRLRWYGPTSFIAVGQLEIKQKSERAGWKETQNLPIHLDLAQVTWGELTACARAQAGGIFREMLAVSQPVLINWYQRQYFVSANGEVRLTLDEHLTAFDQRMSLRPNLLRRTLLIDQMVIELKSDVKHHQQLAGVLAEFPLRVNRHSKFVNGVGSVLGW